MAEVILTAIAGPGEPLEHAPVDGLPTLVVLPGRTGTDPI